MRTVTAALAGLVFGLGLIVSGMVNPAKVLGFLDITGAWDPSLALVMGGAIVVTLPGYRWLQSRGRGLGGVLCQWPPAATVDWRLLAGAALFGAGWGLAGICPGPGVLLVPLAWPAALWFVVPMLAALWITRSVLQRARP